MTTTSLKMMSQVTKVPMPMQVFGSEFFWNAHRADVLRFVIIIVLKSSLSFCIRILILKKYGGIYLDNDILVINNFNRCFHIKKATMMMMFLDCNKRLLLRLYLSEDEAKEVQKLISGTAALNLCSAGQMGSGLEICF